MALFKIFNNFNNSKSVHTLTSHTPGYCYFDKTTGKFWVDTGTTAADMLLLSGTFYGTCSSTGVTAAKVVNDCPGFVLYTGASIYVKFTETNLTSVGNLTLNVNNTGAHSIKQLGTESLNNISAITAGLVVSFVFDGTNWLWVGLMNTDTNTIPSAYCDTGSTTAAKIAKCTNYVQLTNLYLYISFAHTNIAMNNLTLQVENTEAKPIYLNGAPSNSTNYDLLAGTYLAFYDGTAYLIRTDGVLPGKTADSIVNITNSGSTISYTKGDGTTASFVIPNTEYTSGSSISIENNLIINAGVREVSLGDTNGTIKVNVNGTTKSVSVKGLKSAAYTESSAYAAAAHTHGNITNTGLIDGNNITISDGDRLLISDSSNDDLLVKSSISFDGTSVDKVLTLKGTWETIAAAGGSDSDTLNTAGATDTSSKIYLIGALNQSANPLTYSHDTVYVDTDGALYAPTAATGTSTTLVATTEFVMDIVGDVASLLASI